MPIHRPFRAAALLALLAGCAAPQSGVDEPVPETLITIRGSIAFRENVAPPSGSIATVTVREFGSDDAGAVASATVALESARVMLPFELEVPESRFDPSRQYAVTAAVSGPDDEVQWTSDIAQLIDVSLPESDVGVLLMTRARRPGDPERD